MTPVHIVLWAGGMTTAALIGLAFWSEPQIPWFWWLPLGAMAYLVIGVALAIPTLGLLLLAERSPQAYVPVVVLVGAAMYGGIGAANGVATYAALFGAALYYTTATVITRCCDMGTNCSSSGREEA